MGGRLGPLVHLRILSKDLLILNDAEVVADLLDKRSAMYSGRPSLPMVCDLMGWSWNIGFMNYDNAWRAHRRVLQRYFGTSSSPRHLAIIRKNNRIFLDALLIEPTKYQDHIQRSAAANVLTMAYGIDIAVHNDPLIALAEEAEHSIIASGLPGSFAVDVFPILKHYPQWAPGGNFQRIARAVRPLAVAMKEAPYAAAKDAIKSGRASSSLVVDMLDREEDGVPISEELIKNCAGAMYLAAVDTTAASIMSFIVGILRNPGVYQKVREEIASVIGSGRLPEYSDRPHMPYTDAAILESYRLYPVAPLGVPHSLQQDDEYRGYRIPAGTTVMANSWAIMRDPKRFPDPDAFRPERYLDAGGRLDPSAANPTSTCFGAGRRICPGRHFADSSIWFAVTGLLTCFDVYCPTDSAGNKVVPTEEMVSGLVAVPVPFTCGLRPRSEKITELIRAAQEDAE
ncbi:cytochrome P450 [Auricularia subglabra TFB-10046 SS5]|nr:cytochrome P450 [Auricularia subglabra TFB-10046 SS5]